MQKVKLILCIAVGILAAGALGAQELWYEVQTNSELAGMWRGGLEVPFPDEMTNGMFESTMLLDITLEYDDTNSVISMRATIDMEQFLDDMIAYMQTLPEMAELIESEPDMAAVFSDKALLWGFFAEIIVTSMDDEDENIEMGDYYVSYMMTDTVSKGINEGEQKLFINADRTKIKINLKEVMDDSFPGSDIDGFILERQYNNAVL